MGQHNRYVGKVHAYEAIHGNGGAVVGSSPRRAASATRSSTRTTSSGSAAIGACCRESVCLMLASCAGPSSSDDDGDDSVPSDTDRHAPRHRHRPAARGDLDGRIRLPGGRVPVAVRRPRRSARPRRCSSRSTSVRRRVQRIETETRCPSRCCQFVSVQLLATTSCTRSRPRRTARLPAAAVRQLLRSADGLAAARGASSRRSSRRSTCRAPRVCAAAHGRTRDRTGGAASPLPDPGRACSPRLPLRNRVLPEPRSLPNRNPTASR